MDYRPVPDDHVDAYDRLLAYAFAPERGPDPDRDGPDRPEGFHRRGLYGVDDATPTADLDADDLGVACGYHDFSMRLRGDVHDVGGVSAVASPPEHRRSGLVREMLGALHEELRDGGVAFAALWPFKYEFYARMGYARVSAYSRTTVDVDALSAAAPKPAGEFVRLRPDDWERLDAVYDAAATEPLAFDRTEDWWRCRVFQSWESDPFVYGWERDGDLRGYVVYAVDEDDGDRTLAVREHAAVDAAARGHLLRFCWTHDSQVDRVRLGGNATDWLFDLLDDPAAADTTVKPGAMLRVVDVPAALTAVDYPDGADVDVALDVTDGGCPWNDDAFRLSVADGDADCGRTDGSPDATLGIGALSRLVVGSHAADRLATLGDLDADDDALAALDKAFPAADPPPHLREGF
ncbi:GNAT family N-acetyltransferase [Halobaculum sp. P14]|uniref:GNAT family N-acetyltransferase n=1 Tax=Halobaculum sp. P14 TaxID=3421638 RepID=UPI003EC07BB5